MTLQDFQKHCSDFITYLEVEKNLALNTRRSYECDLNQCIYFWHNLPEAEKNNLGLQQIIERHLVSLFYKKIDKSSIARKFSCFKSLERFLKNQGVTLNLKLTRPRLDKKLPIYLSVDEMFHLLDTIKDSDLPSKRPIRDKTILELFYATGIRCSELIAIRFQDLDMINMTIRIKGKGGKERLALFNEKAKKKLLDYFNCEREAPREENETIFLNAHHGPLTARSVQRIIEMFRAFLKIERPITPHKIRHSFATHLLNQGTDLRVVQELLGHQSLSSTEKYTHVSLEDLARLCDTNHPLQAIIKAKKQ